MGVAVGTDISLDQLRREHDAVLVATGAGVALDAPEDAFGAESAMAFLRAVRQASRPAMHGAVLVVGGGNEAIEAARAARRLGAESVTVIWEKTRDALPAFRDAVSAAEAEGVRVACETRVRSARPTDGGGFTVVLDRNGETSEVIASRLLSAPGRRADVEILEDRGLRCPPAAWRRIGMRWRPTCPGCSPQVRR